MQQQIVVQISGEVSGLERATGRARDALGRFVSAGDRAAAGFEQVFGNRIGRQLASVATAFEQSGKTLSTYVSAPLAALSVVSLRTFADLDGLKRGLATLEGSADSLRSRLAQLTEVAKLPGLGLKEAIGMDVALRSAGFSADLSKRSLIAFGNALATVGKGKNELKGVGVQLQQLATKQGGFGADLRIIKEYAPQVGAALMTAFGTIDTERIAKAGFTGRQVIERIVNELAKLPPATGGARNAFENFGDVTTRVLATVGESIFKSLHVEGLLNSVGSALLSVADAFAGLPATTQAVVSGFGLLAVAIPPIIAALGILTTTVLPALKAGMIAVRTAATLMLGPWGVVAAAAVAAAVLIVTNWDKVKVALSDSGVWTQLKDIVGSSLGAISAILGVFVNAFQGDWGNMWKHFVNIGKYAWNAITSVIGAGILATESLLAQALKTVGLESFSQKVESHMAMVEKRIADSKFKINAPVFDPFEGFQFGKQAAMPDSKADDGKKDKTDHTTLGVLGRTAESVEGQITALYDKIKQLGGVELIQKNKNAEGLKLVEEMAVLHDRLRIVRDEIENIQNLTKNPSELIVKINTKSAKEALSQNELAGKERQRGLIASGQPFTMGLNNQVATIGLPGLQNFQKQHMEEALHQTDDFRKNLLGVYSTLNESIKNASADTAADMADGIGQVVGGIVTGQTSLFTGLLGLVTDFLAAYLSKIAQANLIAGAAMVAAGALSANPVMVLQGKQKITAGTGLKVASGLVKVLGNAVAQQSMPAFAKGVTSFGTTLGVFGEYPGASRNPEFTAPVNIGANLIGDRLAKMGGFGGGMAGGEFVVRGTDLVLVLQRAGTTKLNFGS